MLRTEIAGIVRIETPYYALEISESFISVILAGEEVCRLNPISAVLTDQSEAEGNVTLTESRSDEPEFIWRSTSSLWKSKEYILICKNRHFEYLVRVHGHDSVDSVNYFSGDMNGEVYGSEYEFDTGFTPIPTVDGAMQNIFSAQCTRTTFSYLMIPPLFAYSFKTEGIEPRLAFGLAADAGEHNFTQFNYQTVSQKMRRRFWLSTDQSLHTKVDGIWESPRILCYPAESDNAAMKYYCDYYYDTGRALRKACAEVPRFWYGPMACGWIEQAARSAASPAHPSWIALSREDEYNDYIDKIHSRGLDPKILIIDDKWQKNYGTAEPDTEKWKDLRAFIDRQREAGIYVMLWFKLWDAEGFDDSLCLTDEGQGNRVIDPSNPEYKRRLAEIIHRLISSDEGCANACGFKLDYGFWQPVGRSVVSHSGKYGVELFLELISYIYECTKKEKPEAIINASPCHPIFAQYVDHARLHDYYPDLRRCFEEFSFRREMYNYAMPDALIDTDGASFSSRRDTMRYLTRAQELGIPDLYCVTPTPSMELSDSDWKQVADTWREYSAAVDMRYKK